LKTNYLLIQETFENYYSNIGMQFRNMRYTII